MKAPRVYIYRERQRESEGQREKERENFSNILIEVYIKFATEPLLSKVIKWLMLYTTRIHIRSGNIIEHKWRTWMNERTHLLIKICISHTLFSMFLWCERWGRDCYIDPTSSPDQSSTSSTSWLGLLNRGSLRTTALIIQAGLHSGFPGFNWLTCRRHLPIFFYHAHLLPLLLPFIYTGASLIDGLVKCQYTTLRYKSNISIF